MHARVKRHCVAKGSGKGLELRFYDVVGIASTNHPNVQRDLSRGNKGFENVSGQGGVVTSDQFDNLGFLVHQVGPSRQVDSPLGLGFIQRHQGISVPACARSIAEGFSKSGAHG